MFSLLLLLFLCMSKMVTAYPTVSYAFPTRLCVFPRRTLNKVLTRFDPPRGGAGNSYNTTPIPTIERVEKVQPSSLRCTRRQKNYERAVKQKKRRGRYIIIITILGFSPIYYTPTIVYTHNTRREPQGLSFFFYIIKVKKERRVFTLLYLFAALGTGHGTRCTVWRTQEEEERWLPPLPRCFFSRQISSSSSLILKKEKEFTKKWSFHSK